MKQAFVGSLLLLMLAYSSMAKTAQIAGINVETQTRIGKWKSLITSAATLTDSQKLQRVNDFVNEFKFIDDIVHWQKQDYWATPLQTLVTQAGDCEDLSIAKYFTLIAMGVDEAKLRLTYVKQLPSNQAHMVLLYIGQVGAEPVVLDNLNARILPSSARNDLLTVYSFNASGLWLAEQGKSEQYIDDPKRLKPWQRLLQSMDVEAANETAMICRYQNYGLAESATKMHCSNMG